MKIPIDKIRITGLNPREEFSEESLKKLAESMAVHGLLQPIVVRPRGDWYELVIGERRLKAAQMLGWSEIEAQVRDVEDVEAVEKMLVENIQREDLTDAEKGDAVYDLMALHPERYVRGAKGRVPTLVKVAEKLGVSYHKVFKWTQKAQKLSPKVRKMVKLGEIEEKHAYELLRLSHERQDELAELIATCPKKLSSIVVAEIAKKLAEDPEATALEIMTNIIAGFKRVTVNLSELSPEVAEEVSRVVEEKKKEGKKRHREALRRRRWGVTKRIVEHRRKAKEPKKKMVEILEEKKDRGVFVMVEIPTEHYVKLASYASKHLMSVRDAIVHIVLEALK